MDSKSKKPDGPLSRRTMLLAALIALLSSGLGLGANALRPDAIPFIYVRTAPPQTRSIELEEARQIYDQGDALFLDSRSPAEFAAGHICGAINMDTLDPAEIKRLLADSQPDRPLVAYCSGEGCHTSDLLAQRLLELGYSNIMLFFGGWPEWSAAGFPTAKQPTRPGELFPPQPSESCLETP